MQTFTGGNNMSLVEEELGDIYSGLFTQKAVEDLTLIDFIVVYTCVCVFGIVTNIINVCVYLKMKSEDTVNVSLLSLSISDVLSLFFLLLVSISYYPVWDASSLGVAIQDIDILVFAWPQFCFRRISNWITAFVTFERCVCVVRPLKVKAIFTPRRTVTAMAAIAAAMALTVAPAYFAAGYQWIHDSVRNGTMLKLVAFNNSAQMDGISIGISFVLTNATFVWIIVCTTLLVVSLYKKSRWRETIGARQSVDLISKRDKKVMKMIILLAAIFIVTFTPDVVTLLTMTFDQRVSIYGQYFDLFLLLNGIGEPLLALGSSVNLFVYLSMSRIFRKTFWIHYCKLVY